MVNSKRLAEILGISVQAVNLARQEGRITPLRKEGREFVYDPDRALAEYHNKTSQPKASKAPLPPEIDAEWEDGFEEEPTIDENGIYTDKNGNKKKKRSVLDVPSKFWNTHQAQNAKAIFDAQMKQRELEVLSKKYLPTVEIEKEILRITTEFSRALVGMPAKLKQKLDKLDDRDLSVIRELCKEILENCESKL